jgi:L-aspartate oxidase
MWERVGILRERGQLERAVREFDTILSGRLNHSSRNFVSLAQLVAGAALWRKESRGAHFRTDFPKPDEAWRFHSIQRAGEPISGAERISFDTARAA